MFTAILWDYDGTLANTPVKNIAVTRAVLGRLDPALLDPLPDALSSLAAYQAANYRWRNWRASAPRTTAATSAPPWPPTARRTALPPWWATRTWTSPVRSRTPPPSWPAWTGWGFGRGASPTSGTTPGTSPSAAMPRRPCGPWAGRRRWSAWPLPGAAPRPWIWRRRTPWPSAPRTCRIFWQTCDTTAAPPETSRRGRCLPAGGFCLCFVFWCAMIF